MKELACFFVFLDALHQILICGPVDAANALDDQFGNNGGSEDKEQCCPPGEVGAPIMEEAVADDVDADLFRVDACEYNEPEEPAANGKNEADEGDDGLGVEFENEELDVDEDDAHGEANVAHGVEACVFGE